MKTLALVLAALCVIASANLFQEPAFLQLKTSTFGNAVGSMIEMNMAMENPSGRLNAINDLLNQVEETLQQQDADALALITLQRGQCADAQQNLQNLIDSTQAYIDSLSEEQSNLQTEQQDKTQQLGENQSALQSSQDLLAATQQRITDETDSWNTLDGEYAEAIQACEQSLQILSTLQTSSFVQLKAKFSGVVTLLSKHVSKKASSFVQPVINVLTELSNSQEVDQEQLGKVIDLIQQLLEELRTNRSEAQAAFQDSLNNLQNTVSQTQDAIVSTQALIESLTGRLGEIQTRLDEIAGLLTANQQQLDLNNAALQQLKDQCNGYETDYAAGQALRTGQEQALQQLQDYFHSRVVTSVENINNDAYDDQLTN